MRFSLLLLFLFVSCNTQKKESATPVEDQVISANETPPTSKPTGIQEAPTAPDSITSQVQDTTQVESISWEDELLKVKTNISLFALGSFGEGEEMPTEYRELDWMGLYLTDSLATLQPIKLRFEVEEMQDCGDDVYVSLADEGPTPYFLISGLDSITPGVPYASSQIYEAIDFSHLEHPTITYLFDWGETQKVNEYISEHSRVQWTVSRQTPTETITQTLFEAYKVPLDNHLNIDFMGDLDGDGIYDLIVDIATGYSYSINLLFLSTYAETGEILRPVAVFRTWGC